MITFGSLFSGIGGIDLGLERAGMRCVWQVEIDEYASKVLKKHWPDVTRFRDVRDCGAHNLSVVDLMAGGFPCQDISAAGRRAGITGERSGLWSEFYRIICELRPRYVLVENVAALLYPLRRDGYIEPAPISRVLGDLSEGGYDAEWQCLPAAAVGAPHIRDRAFVVAYATGNRREGRLYEPLTGKQEGEALTGEDGNGQSLAAHADFQSLEVGQVFGNYARKELKAIKRSSGDRRGIWTTEPGIRRVADGVPHRVERLGGLGNAVVPQVAEYIGRCIAHHDQLERYIRPPVPSGG